MTTKESNPSPDEVDKRTRKTFSSVKVSSVHHQRGEEADGERMLLRYLATTSFTDQSTNSTPLSRSLLCRHCHRCHLHQHLNDKVNPNDILSLAFCSFNTYNFHIRRKKVRKTSTTNNGKKFFFF